MYSGKRSAVLSTVVTIIIFGVMALFVCSLLLDIAFPCDPGRGIRPRTGWSRSHTARSVTYAVRRQRKRTKMS